MLYLNCASNGYLSAPGGGYPIRLGLARESMASGVMPAQTYSTVTAVISADTNATAHLGIFMPPVISGGDDLAVVTQTDQAINYSKSTLTATLASTLPATFAIPAGSLSLTAGSATAAGALTSFDSADGSWLGYQVHVDGDNDSSGSALWYTISAVASATSMTLSAKATNTASGIWYLRAPGTLPKAFVVRVWVDGITDVSADTVSRQPSTAGYAISQNAGMPNGATLYSVALS